MIPHWCPQGSSQSSWACLGASVIQHTGLVISRLHPLYPLGYEREFCSLSHHLPALRVRSRSSLHVVWKVMSGVTSLDVSGSQNFHLGWGEGVPLSVGQVCRWERRKWRLVLAGVFDSRMYSKGSWRVGRQTRLLERSGLQVRLESVCRVGREPNRSGVPTSGISRLMIWGVANVIIIESAQQMECAGTITPTPDSSSVKSVPGTSEGGDHCRGSHLGWNVGSRLSLYLVGGRGEILWGNGRKNGKDEDSE